MTERQLHSIISDKDIDAIASKLRLFRGIVSTKSGERLHSQGSLSYTRLRELFLQKLTSLGFDAKQFGLHSLKSGGATAAAQAGVYLNDMVVGVQKQQKTVMSKTLCLL